MQNRVSSTKLLSDEEIDALWMQVPERSGVQSEGNTGRWLWLCPLAIGVMLAVVIAWLFWF